METTIASEVYMNTVTVTKREETPACFGKDWDKNAPECAGGADPSYTDAAGQHTRRPCDFFTSCGTRVAARLVTADRLIRPPVVTPPPQAAPSTTSPFVAYLEQQQAQFVERTRQAAMNAPNMNPLPRPVGTPMAPQVVQPQQPQFYHHPQAMAHPAPMYQLNYQVPGYLSTPETRMPGESIWWVLLREGIRAVFKALGHTGAHFFDSRPLKEK